MQALSVRLKAGCVTLQAGLINGVYCVTVNCLCKKAFIPLTARLRRSLTGMP